MRFTRGYKPDLTDFTLWLGGVMYEYLNLANRQHFHDACLVAVNFYRSHEPEKIYTDRHEKRILKRQLSQYYR